MGAIVFGSEPIRKVRVVLGAVVVMLVLVFESDAHAVEEAEEEQSEVMASQ